MNLKKINIIVVAGPFMLMLILAGCITPKKMNGWVANQYGETVKVRKIKSDYVTISSPLIVEDPVPSTSTKKTKKVLPLLFYWKIDYQTSCILNPAIPINLFTTAFATQANSKGLKQKLNGAKMELTIHKIPNSFSFNDDLTLIWLILAKISWEKLYLLPENRDMLISYRVIKDDKEMKSGELILQDDNKLKQTKFLQSVKNATSQYFVQFDENMKVMAKSAVEQLIAEL